MKTVVIFGGSGFIGTHLTQHLLQTGQADRVHIADIRPTSLLGTKGLSFSYTDVRKPIPRSIVPTNAEVSWIYNLAAIHREPGHVASEYFETNLNGATHVCAFAEKVDCPHIYFTSSISVYGPTIGPTNESSPIQPITPYGGSKYPAELIHERWLAGSSNRRLVIVRPGVMYGPGDPGNIMRMIQAIAKGYFVFPGSPSIVKSYGYIYGLLSSIDLVTSLSDRRICYNYVEHPAQPLAEVVALTGQFLGRTARQLSIPLWAMVPAAHAIQRFAGAASPIHPVRVRKAATPTHIVPQQLIELGFQFRYDFLSSLHHWREKAPNDFSQLQTVRPAAPTAQSSEVQSTAEAEKEEMYA